MSEEKGGPFTVIWEIYGEPQEAVVATLEEATEKLAFLENEGHGEMAAVWDSEGRFVPLTGVTQREYSSYEAMQGDIAEGAK